jgi:peptidoglycan/xylan/chitin deacetylase (PgdA/CDA1 family)
MTTNEVIITTSWDDGHPSDMKLAELLQKYGIPATFYVAPKNRERTTLSPKQIQEIAANFDIGGHTYTHAYLPGLSEDEAFAEIKGGRDCLEEIIGREIHSFCYPRGAYNSDVIKLVKKAGFQGARTIKLFQRKVFPPFEMGVTMHASRNKDSRYDGIPRHSRIRALRNARLLTHLLVRNSFFKDWHEVAMDYLDFMERNGGIFHLCGHSWEIEENEDWEKLVFVFNRILYLSKNGNTILMNNSELIRNSGTK